MAKRYDVDAIAAAFEPVEIVFRGREYVLGRSAAQLLRIQDVRAAVAKDHPNDGTALACALVEPALRALAPEVAEVLDPAPLTAGEQMALLRPMTEVFQALARFRPGAGES